MANTFSMRRVWASWCAAVLLLCVTSAAHSESVPFSGPITMAIGSAPGGGYDQYGRLMAKYVQRFLPGSPTVVPRNMNGAGGMIVLSWLYNSAPRDGSVIATTQGSSVFAPIQGETGAQYDPTRFNWLISLDDLSNMLVVWHTSPAKTAEDALRKELVIGNVAGDSSIVPAMLNRLIGTRFKIIAGYPGTNAVALALERGEVEGTINLSWDSIKATRSQWLAAHDLRVLMQITFHPRAELRDVPSVAKYIKSEADRNILEILLAKQDVGRPFVAPPGMPPETVTLYRRLMSKIATDKNFLADAEKMKLSINPTSGEELETFIKHIYAIPKATIDRMHAEMKLAAKGIIRR